MERKFYCTDNVVIYLVTIQVGTLVLHVHIIFQHNLIIKERGKLFFLFLEMTELVEFLAELKEIKQMAIKLLSKVDS